MAAMILVFVAVMLLVGVTSGFLWWRLGPSWAGGAVSPGAGFDRLHLPSSWRIPPRPDEGVQWTEADAEHTDGWSRALAGLLLVVAVAVAAAALATGVYMAGKYLFHVVIDYFGKGGRL
jgi:hypothetical protein